MGFIYNQQGEYVGLFIRTGRKGTHAGIHGKGHGPFQAYALTDFWLIYCVKSHCYYVNDSICGAKMCKLRNQLWDEQKDDNSLITQFISVHTS